MRILERVFQKTRFTSTSSNPFGPFNSIQIRWKKKPVDTAQTRLESRTRDIRLDKLVTQLHKLSLVLKLQHLMHRRKRGSFVSLQLMSCWRNMVGINVPIGSFIRKYPHIFELFTHPIRRNVCCRINQKFMDLVRAEENAIQVLEIESVKRLKKLLMMSVDGTLHIQALRLIRRELGLPLNFRESILRKYDHEFKLVDSEIVSLVNRDESLAVATVEKWREEEYREKWLSEFETKYAFSINFPTGFRIEAGFREKLRNWQRLPYVKPYETMDFMRVRAYAGIERFEKRVVGIIHEILSLTLEKRVEVERLAHFRRDLGIEVNIRELILKHPGIFYISTKGETQIVFLREAYSKGCLVEPNPVYDVRRKMLDLIMLGCRNSKLLRTHMELEERTKFESHSSVNGVSRKDGNFVLPILQSFDN